MNNKIQSYEIDSSIFYSIVDPSGAGRGLVAPAMRHLAEAYRLSGRSILSIGAGAGLEEACLLECGNRISLLDIDEDGNLRSPIQKAANKNKTDIVYYLGDALLLNRTTMREKAEVLYFSSFTPDEMHRDKLRGGKARYNTLKWIWHGPFHPIVEFACRNLLAENGLLIMQSYYGGVDHTYEKGFLPACEWRLRRLGLRLLDVYSFEREIGIKLFAAVKGGDWQRNEISNFHGRSKIKENAVRIFGESQSRLDL